LLISDPLGMKYQWAKKIIITTTMSRHETEQFDRSVRMSANIVTFAVDTALIYVQNHS